MKSELIEPELVIKKPVEAICAKTDFPHKKIHRSSVNAITICLQRANPLKGGFLDINPHSSTEVIIKRLNRVKKNIDLFTLYPSTFWFGRRLLIHREHYKYLVGREKSKDMGDLKEALRHHAQGFVEWDDRESWGVCSLLESAVIGKHYIIITITKTMLKRFATPKIFASIPVISQAKFKGRSAAPLNELLRKELANSGLIEMITREFPINYLKTDVFELDKDAYSGRNNSFMERSITPGIKEINKKGELYAEPIPIYGGQTNSALIALQFKIIDLKAKQKLSSLVRDAEVTENLFKQLIQFEMDTPIARGLIQKYDPLRIQSNIDYVKWWIAQGKPIKKTVAAFCHDAITRDYAKEIREKEAEQKKEAEKLKEFKIAHDKKCILENELSEIKKSLSKFKNDYADYKNRTIENRYAELPQQEKDALLEDFEKHISAENNRTVVTFYLDEKQGLNCETVQTRFRPFFMERYNVKVQSFDDWSRKFASKIEQLNNRKAEIEKALQQPPVAA